MTWFRKLFSQFKPILNTLLKFNLFNQSTLNSCDLQFEREKDKRPNFIKKVTQLFLSLFIKLYLTTFDRWKCCWIKFINLTKKMFPLRLTLFLSTLIFSRSPQKTTNPSLGFTKELLLSSRKHLLIATMKNFQMRRSFEKKFYREKTLSNLRKRIDLRNRSTITTSALTYWQLTPERCWLKT